MREGGQMHYKRKKNKIVTTLLFLLLAVIFICSTGFLSYKIPRKLSELNESKEVLTAIKEINNNMKVSLEEYTETIKKVETHVTELEKKLDEAKVQNPEIKIDTQQEATKFAYLTFDDGPSENTVRILDFLKANNIQATFFVLGKQNQDEVYKRIVDEGHTLALHSNTHQYDEIYTSVDNFMEDINTLADKLETITGVRPSVMRFPGGSNNTISNRYGGANIMDEIIPAVEALGLIYFDWNVDSLDASKNLQDKDVIVNSVLSGAKGKDHAVILMHDATPKTTTVEALPEIVEGLRKQGFVFRAIDEDTHEVQFK